MERERGWTLQTVVGEPLRTHRKQGRSSLHFTWLVAHATHAAFTWWRFDGSKEWEKEPKGKSVGCSVCVLLVGVVAVAARTGSVCAHSVLCWLPWLTWKSKRNEEGGGGKRVQEDDHERDMHGCWAATTEVEISWDGAPNGSNNGEGRVLDPWLLDNAGTASFLPFAAG